MGWNVSIVKLSAHINTLSGVEAYLLPLDAEIGVIEQLSAIFPHIKFETLPIWGTWGYLNGDDYTVQFELGSEPFTTSKIITLHVRGWNSEGVLNEVIRPLCEYTNWLAFDMSEGRRIDFTCPEPLLGFDRWRHNRNRRLNSIR
jgi:hypothetical protein